ncbi:hypothetical protein DFS34DRAFT_691589 [Phlyctochytrium arcticum]|nr:hypothetical protein DFS34DRAFT_691589 [Phlyctochytrium arcticum]
MPVTQIELQRRQIALVKAVKANDNAKVRRLLKDCREWDNVPNGIGRPLDKNLCFCCFKTEEYMSPAKDAALRTAIALGSRDLVSLILDSGLQNSPRESHECYSHTAVRFEQADILRILLERNLISDEWAEQSAIRLAISKGSLPLIEPFIEYGAVNQHKVVEIAIELGKLEIRQRDENQLQSAVIKIFKTAANVPILEFCMFLANGISDEDRNEAVNNAVRRGRTEASNFLIQHGATPNRHTILLYLRFTREESHFICLWNLLGGTGNLDVLTHYDGQQCPLVYDAIRQGFWNVIETCLRHPAFKMNKSHHNLMVFALRRAVNDQQENLLLHMIKNVPDSRSILLTDIAFPIPAARP